MSYRDPDYKIPTLEADAFASSPKDLVDWAVESGKGLVVTKDGIPYAAIVPYPPHPMVDKGRGFRHIMINLVSTYGEIWDGDLKFELDKQGDGDKDIPWPISPSESAGHG